MDVYVLYLIVGSSIVVWDPTFVRKMTYISEIIYNFFVGGENITPETPKYLSFSQENLMFDFATRK